MNIKHMALLLLAIGALSGCVEYRWVKSGTSEHDRQVQLTACEAQSLKDLPPDNVETDTYSTSATKDKKNDSKIEKNKDTHHRVSDANASQREVLVDNCMLQTGWTRVAVQQ